VAQHFNDILSLIQQQKLHLTLNQMVRGIEKESLRIEPNGHLAQTPHPTALGSALTHTSITTDYSEALLEFITPTFTDVDEMLEHLEKTHRYTYQQLDNEKLWVNSMPCIMGDESSIPIATFGNSNVGRMKYVYRLGLWHRYGKLMQTIAGIHYNVSMPDDFWPGYQKLHNNTDSLQDFISAQYFGLIRNFQRFVGLVIYLYGASPTVCGSFLKGRDHGLEKFNDSTLYLPYGTSLRMSDLGYQNDAQAGLLISYNSLNEYVADLTRAIQTPHPAYETLGVRKNKAGGGEEYQQLNTNILQIENEYYGSIRPKRVARSGEKPTCALATRGVEYIEMRCVDLNPFEPIGISAEKIRFLDVFAVLCLVEPSPTIDTAAQQEIDNNQEAIVMQGRKPNLQIHQDGEAVCFKNWGHGLLDKMAKIATLMDEAGDTNNYSNAIANQKQKVDNPEKTPSAKIINTLRENDTGFYHFAMEKALEHETYFRNNPLSEDDFKIFQKQSAKSLQQQIDIENSDTLSFEQYLTEYFEKKPCENP